MKIAIVGAGAAGLMCACMLDVEHTVVVFDKNESVGKKLLLTGNGRCNLTNLVSSEEFLESIPQGREFLKHSIGEFTPNDTIKFFNKLGVETIVESDNRVFPKQGKANGVRQALEDYARARGVEFRFDSAVADVVRKGEVFEIMVDGFVSEQFDAVIIATGGVSFPSTGSTGDGYEIASKLGHKNVSPRPALCGLQFETTTGFQGIGVRARVTLGGNSEVGNAMFTKNGIGGPLIFKLSSLFGEGSVEGEMLNVDFVPDIERPIFDVKDKPFYAFRKHLPQNVANWLVGLGMKPKDIKNVRIKIKDFEPIEIATVTRGGVCISEINPETMESKHVQNLFFIGEVIDVDGLSGGFNLQIAFSTAVVCARSIR